MYDIPGVGNNREAIVTIGQGLFPGDLWLVSTTATYTLPAAANSRGRHLYIKKTDSNSYTVTIDGYGSETIDGNANITLVDQYETVHLLCDGSNWYIV